MHVYAPIKMLREVRALGRSHESPILIQTDINMQPANIFESAAHYQTDERPEPVFGTVINCTVSVHQIYFSVTKIIMLK